jgi:release factor glutamine methyltransferase
LAQAVAIDLSINALTIARTNAEQLQLSNRMAFTQSNWFENIDGTFDLIVSNPPYIASQEILSLEIEVRDYDPHLALDGGDDGLHAYRAIASGTARYMTPHGMVAVEIGAGQTKDVENIFQEQGFSLSAQKRDLGGHIRALLFRR